MPESAGSARRIGVAERRARAIELRRQRYQFHEIAAIIGVSKTRAWELYQEGMAAIPQPQRDLHRAESLMLIDDAIKDLLVIALNHKQPRASIEAWNSIRGFVERKARMMGEDAPTKIEVTDAIDADIERLVAELAGLAPGGEAAAAGAPGGGGEQAQTA